MLLKLTIQADKLYEPVVLGGVQWETAQKGEPGKLTFTVVKDDVISFNEGALVRLAVDGKDIFQGYVFTKTRNKDHHIRVVAYDQLRYFKNKDVYVYKNKTASELVSMIADDYGLMLGTVEDTKYKIEKRVEDGQSLFDIIENALKITKDNTDKVFVLFDDAGRIALRDIQSMKLNMVIDKDAAEDFDYTSSIDGETYNYIKLVKESGSKGRREINVIVRDDKSIAEWGRLQYYEKVSDGGVDLHAQAEQLLKQYNHKTRSLRITGVLGDVTVRAGCMLPVSLNLGDIVHNSYLICRRVVHTWEQGHHRMDIEMAGGDRFV